LANVTVGDKMRGGLDAALDGPGKRPEAKLRESEVEVVKMGKKRRNLGLILYHCEKSAVQDRPGVVSKVRLAGMAALALDRFPESIAFQLKVFHHSEDVLVVSLVVCKKNSFHYDI
jgi:hypothetical protein